MMKRNILYEDHYHIMEFDKDKIYALYQRINPIDNNDWSDSLWCFSPYANSKLIAQGQGLDFRVSKNS